LCRTLAFRLTVAYSLVGLLLVLLATARIADQKLAHLYDIDMIAPNRRRRNRTQDGRTLRRERHW
jgi:hypothetical protein